MIDLKDAYFHVSIFIQHRPFLRFALERRAYQHKVLPFRLSMSPHVVPKVVKAALIPLRERVIRVLNYLNDWLILAQSCTVMRTQGHGAQSPHPVGASGHLGKEKTLLYAEDIFSWYELDSVNLTARLSIERAQSMLNCLESFQGKRMVPLKQFQRLLGHIASTAAVMPLGLLHVRPLQCWLLD